MIFIGGGPSIYVIALFAVWLAFFLWSCLAVLVSLTRHGLFGLEWSFLCPLGAVLSFAWVSAATELIEKKQSPFPHETLFFWCSVLLGLGGMLLWFAGWRKVLRPKPRPGLCIKCEYPAAGLAVCPECGTKITPDTLT